MLEQPGASGPGWIRTSEAFATVLQTVPFGHSGTDPWDS